MIAVGHFIRRWPLTCFILLNYGISWAFLYPCYRLLQSADEGGFPPLALIGLVGAYGPSIAAVIITRVLDGAGGVKALFRRILVRGVSLKWYVFAVAAPALLMTIALLGAAAGLGFSPGRVTVVAGLRMVFPYLLIALPFGPMGEELGWRGFLLPRLLKRHSLIRASLLLGLAWTFWHLASFTFPGAALPGYFQVNALTIVLYLGTLTGETYLMTWVYLKTRGSILISVLFHAGFNAAENILFAALPELSGQTSARTAVYVAHMILLLLVGLGLLIRISGGQRRE